MKPIDIKREDLARALAERNLLTEGEAQDELDRVVHRIVRSLRRGRAAAMPGIGRLTARIPGPRRMGSGSNPRSPESRHTKP